MSCESTSTTLPAARRLTAPAPTRRDLWARTLFLRLLGGIRTGALVVQEGGATHRFGQPDGQAELTGVLAVHDPRFYREALFGGSVGAGEAYMRGWWSSPDLARLVRLVARNEALREGIESGWAWLRRPALSLWHFLRANTRAGSRRNIIAHYDLGNDFFQLFLDPTMMYSSAVFPTPESSLEEAQHAKLERICRKLDLRPGDHLVEIGTGWGGLALHAARHYGCRVTTTTISPAQASLARQRLAAAGLDRQVEVLECDYRDLRGTYDKLVSIEMVEAVGWRHYDEYFAACARLLKPHGVGLLQAIMLNEQRYRQARDHVDFIKRYIFPGSCLPSMAAITESVARATDLHLFHFEDLTGHYARTLAAWRQRFLARAADVRRMGFPEEFLRMWDFYFAYCEGGFAEHHIALAQVMLGKPAYRRTDFPSP